MRTWIYQGSPPRASQHTETGGSIFNFTPAYMEMITPVADHIQVSDPVAGVPEYLRSGLNFVLQFFQLDEHRWMVCTCWGRHFDFFDHLLQYPDTSAGVWRAVRESCPTFNTLYQRRADPYNHDAALFQINDPESNELVWVLGGFFGNVVVTDIAHFFDGYPRTVFNGVLELSLKLAGETINGPMAVPKLVQYIGAEAEKEEFRAMVRAAPKIFKEVANLGRILGG